MQAIVVDPSTSQRLGFRDVESPAPQANEALVRVKAVSLNRGEVFFVVKGAEGTRLGWDVAGIVEQGATDGSGPARGTQVVGLASGNAWAERVAVSTSARDPLFRAGGDSTRRGLDRVARY